jgi:hypothetical protein
MDRKPCGRSWKEYDFDMKRLAIALFDLAKSVIAKPVKPREQASVKLHWTKFDKPIDEMTHLERRAAAERLADEMLGVIKKNEK